MTDRFVQPTDPALDDLLSREAVDHPSAYYSRVRDVHPVYWNERWNGWILTGYDEVVSAYRDAARLSSDRFAGPFGEELSTNNGGYDQLFGFLSKFFVWKDAPYHTRVRALVNQAFTPKSVEKLRPRIQHLVREIVDPLRGRDGVDFLREFAFHLPVVVIAEYLGIPAEARQDVRMWSDDLGAVIFVRGDDVDRMRNGEVAMGNLVDFLRPIVRARRTDPKDDLLTGMVQAQERGDFLSEDEVIANAILMVFAGHETTMNLLTNGIVAFHHSPGEWKKLADDPAKARTATEEVLRYDGPIRAMARWAKEPFVLSGREIKEKDRLLLVQAGANHDPSAFERPDQFDIERWPNRHAAFGQGIHTCLGAPLARLEAQEAFSHLASEFAAIEVREERLQYNATLVSRSLPHLRVAFHSR